MLLYRIEMNEVAGVALIATFSATIVHQERQLAGLNVCDVVYQPEGWRGGQSLGLGATRAGNRNCTEPWKPLTQREH